MKKIEVYEDPNGRISLRQYSSDGNRCELVIKDEDVYHYLSRISTDSIEEVRFLRNTEGVESVGIITDKHKIKLADVRKLEKHEAFLAPLLTKVERKIEQDSIKNVKKNRTMPPKVTRKNKHSNSKIKIAGVVLAGIILAGGISQYASLSSKGENLDNTISTVVSEVTDVDLDEESLSDYTKLYPETIEEGVTLEVSDNTSYIEPLGVEFSYEDRSNTPKADYVINEYGHLLTKYATMYGVDPNLMIAIATQERGTHSSIMDDGGATGIMQMQNAVWLGKEISAYNVETGQRDTYTVDSDMIENLETNIKMGCMYFQNCLDYMNYNIPAAIQCYNMGINNMRGILDAYANEQGMTRSDVLSNPLDTGWMNYRYLSDGGDENYLENVVSWLGNDMNISVFNRNDDNNVMLTITNSDSVKRI